MDTTSSTSFATADTATGTPAGPTPTVASNGMDFFFAEAPDQLLGATELDIQLSPLLQDRIAQLCLVKMRQASSGRESLQRLARLSCFWRRLQAEVQLMPMFATPQVPAPLEQWLAEFAALEPSTPPLQGSTDFNWGLDLLAPPPGGLGLELDLWNMESVPQDLTSIGALPFPFSVQPPAPSPFLDSSNNLQTLDSAKLVPLEESLASRAMDSSAIAAQEVGAAIEAEIPVSSSYSSIPAYVIHEQPSVVGSENGAVVSDAFTCDQPLQDVDTESPSSDMDVDLPIEDMALSSPPPSPSKRRVSATTRKPASGQRRTRKSNRVVRQSRKAKKEPEPFTARLASLMQESGEELEQASRIKRRRGSEDSSSSDSSPESAPSSPRTPPSTYDGPSTPSSTSQSLYHLDSICSKDAGPNKTSAEPPSTVSCQDQLLSRKTSHHVGAVVAVEDLVNLKRMEEEGEPVHSSLPLTHFPTRRPSTRAFSRS